MAEYKDTIAEGIEEENKSSKMRGVKGESSVHRQWREKNMRDDEKNRPYKGEGSAAAHNYYRTGDKKTVYGEMFADKEYSDYLHKNAMRLKTAQGSSDKRKVGKAQTKKRAAKR